MTLIPVLKVVRKCDLWTHRVAWLLVGAVVGMVVQPGATPPEPVVAITTMTVKVGQSLCRNNEGISRIDRHGARGRLYTFHCQDQATFHNITINEVSK